MGNYEKCKKIKLVKIVQIAKDFKNSYLEIIHNIDLSFYALIKASLLGYQNGDMFS